jgi:hypothetical protein
MLVLGLAVVVVLAKPVTPTPEATVVMAYLRQYR